MYIDFDTTQSILQEEEDITNNKNFRKTKLSNIVSDSIKQEEKVKITHTMDSKSTSNKFRTRPQGVIIQDTYNNFIMPIRPNPRIDTSKFDLLEVIKTYRTLYTQFNPILLPWHYCVEMVQDKYFVFNTRPIDMQYPLDSNTVLKYANAGRWDKETHDFFDRNIVDVSQCLHICLVGDTNLDVYPNKLYTLLGRLCMGPIFGYLKIIRGSTQNVFPLNIGKRFNTSILNKFARR
ncbi:MAG: hypothetical protein ACOC33_00865 [bacterium]